MSVDLTFPVHGFADIPWDHVSLPDRFWRLTVQLPNGCWVTSDVLANGLRNTVVGRLTGRWGTDIWSIVPTCSDRRCVNPAHLCVVEMTPLSIKED